MDHALLYLWRNWLLRFCPPSRLGTLWGRPDVYARANDCFLHHAYPHDYISRHFLASLHRNKRISEIWFASHQQQYFLLGIGFERPIYYWHFTRRSVCRLLFSRLFNWQSAQLFYFSVFVAVAGGSFSTI